VSLVTSQAKNFPATKKEATFTLEIAYIVRSDCRSAGYLGSYLQWSGIGKNRAYIYRVRLVFQPLPM
jgi:hypothetical protein